MNDVVLHVADFARRVDVLYQSIKGLLRVCDEFDLIMGAYIDAGFLGGDIGNAFEARINTGAIIADCAFVYA